MVTRVLILSALVFVGCEKRSTKYCGMHENDLANCPQLDAPPPPLVMCMTDAECTGGHCELGANICVECLDNSHCDPSERCDVDGSFSCRGCIADTDCTGGVCLPGGSCGTDDDVIYVGPGGADNAGCTFSAPCATLTFALTEVTATRKTIHYSGATTESVTIKDLTVDIVAAPDAVLTGAVGPDWALKLDGAITTVSGLTVICGGGSDQRGIEVIGAATGTLDRVDISGCGRDGGVKVGMSYAKITRSNIHDNPAGGLKGDNSAEIVLINNWIHHNGTVLPASAYGGVFIDTDMPAGKVKVEFNTIADNQVSGLECDDPFEVPNNIIVGNGTLLENNLISCTAGNSLVMADKAPLAFTNSAMGDYHIGATSAAKDAAMVTLGIENDYDGELRPQGMAPDLGADEYKAP